MTRSDRPVGVNLTKSKSSRVVKSRGHFPIWYLKIQRSKRWTQLALVYQNIDVESHLYRSALVTKATVSDWWTLRAVKSLLSVDWSGRMTSQTTHHETASTVTRKVYGRKEDRIKKIKINQKRFIPCWDSFRTEDDVSAGLTLKERKNTERLKKNDAFWIIHCFVLVTRPSWMNIFGLFFNLFYFHLFG